MDIGSVKRLHVVGLNGIGISALAQWFLAHGAAVSGSDRADGQLLGDLRARGVVVSVGSDPARVPPDAKLLIYSQAVPETDPERAEAARRDIPQLSYPEALGEVTRRYETLAVAGAHGKSTTTALLGLILVEAGLDPTIIVGTKLKELGGNFRAGQSEYLVIEADEYKGAFLNYSPARSAITNIDAEHLDYFRDLDDVESAFLNYAHRVSHTLVVNADDPNLSKLKDRLRDLSVRQGFKLDWYSLADKEAVRVKETLQIPGEYNASNALAAMHLARGLGISDEVCYKVFAKYEGAWRRQELRGEWKGALVYDDYAVHPAEIRATIRGLKEKYPGREVVAVFQPHQQKRLSALFDEFRTAFDAADLTLILPVYKVAGRDADDPEHSAERLAHSIQAAQPGKKLFYLADTANLEKALETLGTSHKIILMMGAGDIVSLTDRLFAD